jgi:hypothetical protein
MRNSKNRIWTEDNIKSKIKILKGNEIYRVGDVKHFSDKMPVVKEILTNKKYKDSILYDYFNQPLKGKRNFIRIFQQKKGLIRPIYDDNYILVHIRTGDDLKFRGLTQKNQDILLNKIHKYSTDKKVIIVTAMHYGHKESSKFYKQSCYKYTDGNYEKNIKLINQFILKINNPVIDILSNENVDKDLLHLVHCENLVACEKSGKFANDIIKWNKQIKLSNNANDISKWQKQIKLSNNK